MEINQQADSARSRSGIMTTALILRIIAGGLLSAVVLTVSTFFLSSTQPSGIGSPQDLIVRIVSGVLYVAVMTPLARRVLHHRFLAIFLPLYITGTLADLIEAYFYTTLLAPVRLVAALIIEGLPILAIAGIITWLIPASEAAHHEPGIGEAMRERSFFSWVWRIILAGAPYALIYLFFASLVAPFEHAYYNDPAFIASLHTLVPSTAITIGLEVVRGILFVLALLPVITVIRKSRWSTGLYIALIGAVLEAWIPLLGMTSWPVMMRVGNVLELTGDACGRALLITLLVALPRLNHNQQARKPTEPAESEFSGSA